jgi:hypothetical protein
MKLIDLTGKAFGRWSVKSYAGQSHWNCLCECGAERKVFGASLTLGKSLSCGCYAIEKIKTHGMSGSRVYAIWEGMKARCSNPSSQYWHRYGGRGIKVCDRWKLFENFFADVGEPPTESHSIGRINNDGDYEPSNVQWETAEQQNHNKVLNHKVTIDGVTKTLTQWAQENGLKPSTVMSRVAYGWNDIDAVSVPAKRGQKYRSLTNAN